MSDENRNPRRWQLKKEFIDSKGNMYHYGKLQPKFDDSILKTDDDNKLSTTEEVKKVEVPADFLKEMQDRIDKLEAKIQKEQATQKEEIIKRFGNGIDEPAFGKLKAKDIEVTDYLKTPVKFVKFGRGWVISTYFIGGQEILSPYGRPLTFTGSYSEPKSLGGDKYRVIPYCEYSTNSKKEVGFLRKSPYFGTVIFDNAKDAIKGDFDNVTKVEQATITVSRLDKEQLFKRANELNMDINQSEEKLRGYILQYEVDLLKKYEKEQLDKVRKESIESSVFSNSTV